MYFRNLWVNNFLSISNIHIDFTSLSGINLVLGKNLDADEPTSNASGKSSLFESLLWVLYGELSRSTSNDVNCKYAVGDTSVRLTLEIPNLGLVDVTRIRTKSGTHKLSLSVDGTDYTKPTLRSTESYLSSILPPKETVLFTIYFSQEFNARFTRLGNKDRILYLENILDISIYEKILHSVRDRHRSLTSDVDRHRAVLTNTQQSLQKLIEYKSRLTSDRDTKIAAAEKEISDIERSIEETKTALTAITSTIDDLTSKRRLLETKHQGLLQYIDNLSSQISDLNSSIASLTSKKDMLLSQIASVDVSTCSVCTQPISEEFRASIKSRVEDDISVINNDLSAVNSQKQALLSSLNQLKTTELTALNKEMEKIGAQISQCQSRRYEYESQLLAFSNRIQYLKKTISDLDSTIIDQIEENIRNQETEISTLQTNIKSGENRLSILEYLRTILDAKGIRKYLLSELLNSINEHLSHYCRLLFDNTVIRFDLSEDGGRSSLSIAVYGNIGDLDLMSGSERKRADIAIQLSISDVLAKRNQLSSNLFILDEILDTCDHYTSNRILKVFSKMPRTSMILSHNEDIKSSPYINNVITVVKQNGLSTLEVN